MGPLIDEYAVAKYQAALDAVKRRWRNSAGAGVATPGYFVEPTIVRAQNDWDIVQRNICADLYVMTYRTLDENHPRANAVPQGLSSALFTQYLRHSEAFLSASSAAIAELRISTSAPLGRNQWGVRWKATGEGVKLDLTPGKHTCDGKRRLSIGKVTVGAGG